LGIAANYAGQFAGLLIALPLAQGTLTLFNSSPRAETLLPGVLIFLLLSLPMLIFFKEPHKTLSKLNLKQELKSTISNTKAIFSFSGVGFFLLAYFLFNDAILTAANNFPIFLEQVWQIPDTTKTYLMLLILVGSGFGALISGHLSDKFGHKKTLLFLLISWLILLPLLGLITNFILFIFATGLMGLWYGSNWTVSRSVMSRVAPKGKHNLAFAYFGLAERASSLIGPVVWGLIVTNLIELGTIRYRIAIITMTIFIFFGILALLKVKVKETPLNT